MFLLLTTYLLLFIYFQSSVFLVSYLGLALQAGGEGVLKCPSAAKALVQAEALSKTTEKKPGGSHPPKNKH